jgi:hypothetical protein
VAAPPLCLLHFWCRVEGPTDPGAVLRAARLCAATPAEPLGRSTTLLSLCPAAVAAAGAHCACGAAERGCGRLQPDWRLTVSWGGGGGGVYVFLLPCASCVCVCVCDSGKGARAWGAPRISCRFGACCIPRPGQPCRPAPDTCSPRSALHLCLQARLCDIRRVPSAGAGAQFGHLRRLDAGAAKQAGRTAGTGWGWGPAARGQRACSVRAESERMPWLLLFRGCCAG